MDALVWAGALVITVATISLAGLKAWRGWIDLRRFEIAQQQEARRDVTDADPAMRIEMANLKERLRKVEAIATGVDP